MSNLVDLLNEVGNSAWLDKYTTPEYAARNKALWDFVILKHNLTPGAHSMLAWNEKGLYFCQDFWQGTTPDWQLLAERGNT